MSRKNLNFKSTIFKFIIFYASIYLFAFFLKHNDNFEHLIINIEYRYLALINIISIFLGLPLSIVFDLILIKFFNFSQGILFALILIILILIPLLQKNYISWIGEFSPIILLNSIVLGLGVGFAEEIIFRGWLLEELKFEYR